VDAFVDGFQDRCWDAPSLDLRAWRHWLWISKWVDLGISFEPNHPTAQTCETQAVDPLVDRFQDRCGIQTQTCETQAVDQLVDQFRNQFWTLPPSGSEL
jgi:hypothetical protein